MLYIRSPTLFALSTWQLLAFFAWFIVEVVTHSYKDIINVGGTGQQPLPLAEQSLQLFMYTTLLTLACLAAQWFADFTRTRASRHMAAAVATFTMVAWFWNLWFVIPAFDGKNNALNLYCNGQLTSLGRWCHLFQAAAALSVVMEFGIFLTWLWSLFYLGTLRTPEIPIPTQATILAPHHSLVAASESGAHNADVAWNTELTEPDDLEQMKIAANNPQTHAPITNRLTVLGHLTSMLTGASVIGWIVLCCALIDVARYVGLFGWSTQDQPGFYDTVPNANGFTSNNRLGDPIVQANWYWLTLTLGTSIAISAYSSFRRNRAVIGGAMLVAFLSTLQWFSLFIYMARRVHQESTTSTEAISWIENAKHSQYAEVAGAGLIAVAEAIRTAVLFFRYMTYMLVTKLDHDRVHIPSHVDAPTVVQAERDTYNPNYTNAYGGTNTVNTQDYTSAHQNHAHRPVTEMNVPGPSYDAADADLYVPSYNMGIFHGSSPLFRMIFALQALSVLSFWVLQIVYQSNFGLFNIYEQTGSEAPNANQNSFTGPEAPERAYYYNEYQFLLTTVLVLGAWIPAFHAEREVSVASAVAACYTTMLMCLGFFLLIWTFAYESIYSHGTLYVQICNSTGVSTSGVWCNMTQAGGILALINAFFLLCLFLHCMGRLAERRMLITTWENTVQNVPGLLAPLIVIGITIWSFTQLYIGLWTPGLTNQFQDISGMVQDNYVYSYFATQAFLTFATCAFAVWCGVYSSKLMYAWQSWSWRMAAFFSSMAAAAFTVPLLIYACRFFNMGNLNHPEKTLCAALIILCAGTTFYFASFLFLIHTAFYAAGPAGAAIPPTGMALKQNQQFIANKQEQGVAIERDVEMGTVTNVSNYQTNQTMVQTAEPVVNPRTGETVVAVEQHPVAEETVVTQTQPVGLAAPTVVYSSGPQTVQYHDY